MFRILRQDIVILLLLSIFYFVYGESVDTPSMANVVTMGWFCWFQLFVSIYGWTSKGNQLLSPYIIFLIALYVFSNGQSFIWALGFESQRDLIGFHWITISEIFRAQIITSEMLAFFQIGASVYFHRHIQSNYKFQNPIVDTTPYLKQIGWFLFIVSVVPYCFETISDLVVSMTRGYGSIYGAGEIGLNNLTGFVADYFIPSVICLLIVYRQNVIVRRFLLMIILVNILVILLIGGRSNAVILLALILIIYNYLVRRFTKKWLLVGVFGVFALLQVLAFVAQVRVEGNRNSSKMELRVENNAAVDAVAEMGGTMYCLVKTMELVPSKYDYRYGRSYAYAFTTLIPNIGFWDIHPAKKVSNLGDWLTEELSLGYGTGFSMCAEAYINFGYLAFLVFFVWGYFISSVFSKIEPALKSQDYAKLAFMLILFWFFLKLPRNNFINVIRPIFFIAGPIYLYCTKFSRR